MSNPNEQIPASADFANEQAADTASAYSQRERNQRSLSPESRRTIFTAMREEDYDIQQLLAEADEPVFK